MPSHDPCSASASPNTSTSSYLYTCNSTVKLASTAADLDCEKQNAAECIHSIVSLAQWLFPGPSVSYGDINAVGTHKEEFKTHTSPLPMVDLRPSQEYEQKCISNSSNGITAVSHHCKRVVVNLPLESLLNGERSFELPPRNIPFAILVPSKYYTRNNSTLSIDFDQILFEFFYATKSKATKKSRIRWNIPQILLDDESLWADARRLGILLQNDEHPEGATIFPQPRLWEPDAMVRNYLLPLLEKEFSLLGYAVKVPVEVWDLGCGSGRDICFLAESLIQYPIHFVGIDYHMGSASRCQPFWERRLCQQQNRSVTTVTKNINLNKISFFQEYLLSASKGALKMMYCVRYINRKLFHTVANSLYLPRGFLFAVTHFCKETEGSKWEYEHPSVRSIVSFLLILLCHWIMAFHLRCLVVVLDLYICFRFFFSNHKLPLITDILVGSTCIGKE